MPFNLGPRLHALVHGAGGQSDEREVRALYRDTEALFRAHGLPSEGGIRRVVDTISVRVLDTFDLDRNHQQKVAVEKLVAELIAYEEIFALPVIARDQDRPISEWWALRDTIGRQKALLEDFDGTCDALRVFACAVFENLWAACPSLLVDPSEDGVNVECQVLHQITDPGVFVHQLAGLASAVQFAEVGVFDRLRATLEYNLILASGGNPADPRAFSRAPKFANASDIRDPEKLVGTYLGGTPLAKVVQGTVGFTIPTQTRFEHHHIVAGSGHGKTQTLQYLIAHDLGAVARGQRSVVVIDSQGDLIRTISRLSVFAPGAPLHERIVIIDPTDVEYPVSLNLFDVGQERLAGYDLLERERLTNSILELYDFVLGTLLDAQMTQKQSVIFRYVTRLMLHIPDATIHTLRELMEPGAEVAFAQDIAKLTGTARHFFETEFSSREFEQTKRQVLRRLWGILENQTFERMFSHPKSKLDLFHEMNAGKIILINTAKDLLKESGTEIFGRFFIALIAQAAQERSVISPEMRMPTMVYIDEAADYLDRNVGLILSQARKYNVGMVLAHQYMGQLSPGLQDAFAANTSIKFAGGVSAKDARTLAAQMYCEPRFIEYQKKGSFAAHVRGHTRRAIPLHFPFGIMETAPSMGEAAWHQLRSRMREGLAVHYTELDQSQTASNDETGPDIDPNEPTPYW